MSTSTTETEAIDDAMATMHDAGATRVPPWMALIASLSSIRPEGIGATIDWLVAHRAELEAAYAGGRDGKLALAEVPPGMRYTPDLGYMDFEKRDHKLRDRYLFDHIVGKQSFFQTAVYAMTGVELSTEDARMLDQMGNCNLLVDRHAWPMAVTRRVAARGGGYSAAVMSGLAMMGSAMVAGEAAAGCARFLQRAKVRVKEGGTVAGLVDELLARKERVMGFGRPVVGPDERVPVMRSMLVRYGRDSLPFVRLLEQADGAFFAARGLRSTSAAWAAAVLSDYGMTPEQVHAVSNYWVHVNVYAQAIFSGERGVRSEP
jgi:hypothetical protein